MHFGSANLSFFCPVSISDDSQDAFEPYYSETYSENSSLSLRDSQHSLASVSDGSEDNPALLLMHEYMMTVSPSLLRSVMELHRSLCLGLRLNLRAFFPLDKTQMMVFGPKPFSN